jgi:hypothetical protein
VKTRVFSGQSGIYWTTGKKNISICSRFERKEACISLEVMIYWLRIKEQTTTPRKAGLDYTESRKTTIFKKAGNGHARRFLTSDV